MKVVPEVETSVAPGGDSGWPVGLDLAIHGPFGEGGSAVVLDVMAPTGARIALKIARDASSADAFAAEARTSLLASGPGLPELAWCGWVRPNGHGWQVASRSQQEAKPATAWRAAGRRSLREAGVVDVETAWEILRDAASALAVLHAAGLSHGDVTLSNLVRGEDGGETTLIDLGLAAPLGQVLPRGATVRYLDARGDLGDGRGRDLLALGVVGAELVDEAVRASADGVAAARAWVESSASPLVAIVAPLLCPAPAARPGAGWVAQRAARKLAPPNGRPNEQTWERGPGAVAALRSSYLRLRIDELEGTSPSAAEPSWLLEVAARLDEVAQLAGAKGERRGVMAPWDGLMVSRWLSAVVGPAAADWPVDRVVMAAPRDVLAGLEGLSAVVPPTMWTLEQIERAAEGPLPSPAQISGDGERLGPMDRAARLALGLASIPADEASVAAVEADAEAPRSLVLAAADALRLRGEIGRARALVARNSPEGDGASRALAAEIHRRAREPLAAARAAEEALSRGETSGRARSVLARLALDRGELDEAAALAAPLDRAGCLEVAVLIAGARGDAAGARDAAARGRALARNDEERARLAGALGYVLAESAPDMALSAYREAAELAGRAGAVEEEATYRTGEAATAVSEGHLERAVAAGQRAALLWEARGRPELAARAFLACAAAMATAERAAETDRFAELAGARAREGADPRAELFAMLVRCDARSDDVDRRAMATSAFSAFGERALVALRDPSAAAHADALRLLARIEGSGAEDLDAATRTRADERATAPNVDVGARLEWWTARARRAREGAIAQLDDVLAALVATTALPAPLEVRGRAAHVGFEAATARGRSDLAARFEEVARRCARTVTERAGSLAPAVRGVRWVARWLDAGGTPAADNVAGDQARELLRIVRSLEGRERLSDLLDRIVDALVAWTGVERGLLLLPAPEGRLVPRAARRLGRRDLGPEELALSQTLARRALEAGEPVVAVDASGEMADIHRSVHALQLRSVLAVPLVARGEVLGVVYLDDRVRRGAFGPRELAWARTVAALAATILAEARERVLLRRAVAKARRAQARLQIDLDRREIALRDAEARLSTGRPGGSSFAAIIGESPRLLRVLRSAERIARSNVPVLVLGESGTGKELFARALHDGSPRARRSFVSENCSAIPETLLESTLFGHERGAFTGADRSRIGLFEAADGGTLFLDEIGEMSLGMQAKLLRVLEDGLVRHVGGSQARRVDVRVVAATHRDLQAMVAARTFREDLYYRLNIVVLALPPLRERREDVPLLVHHFLARHAEGRTVRLSRTAMDRLVAADWAGNVRQLENEVRRALVLSEDVIEVEHLSDAIGGDPEDAAADDSATMKGRVDALESAMVREALKDSGGNMTQAAKALGVSRFGLQKMVKRLGIERAPETGTTVAAQGASKRRAASIKSR